MLAYVALAERAMHHSDGSPFKDVGIVASVLLFLVFPFFCTELRLLWCSLLLFVCFLTFMDSWGRATGEAPT